jgi:Tol biopolymer transport system component
MRRKAAQALLGALLLAGAIGVAQQRKQQEIDLQAAIRKETVDGDLNGAIKQYSPIVSKYKADRATTAMALVRMADCYRKMGDAESRKLYEQVVKQYADQKEAVALARAGLGGGTQTRRQTNTLVRSGPKTYIDGTVSLDGRYFSYVDWDTGDVALREIATGTDRLLTKTGNLAGTGTGWNDYAEGTAISRDGKQIAYSWWDEKTKRYDLRVLNVAGEPNPRRLVGDPEFDWLAPRDWSPDGKWIAVLLWRRNQTSAIGLVSTTDGSLSLLRSMGDQSVPEIFFSPDGKHIGYDLPESNVSQPRDLFVFDIAARREIPVVTRRGQDFMIGWSPDGKRLLFGSDRSGSLGLWAQMLDKGQPKGTPELLKPDLGSVAPLGVTQSGALYYGVLTAASAGARLQIASIDFASGRISSPRDVSENYLESNFSPVWSSDGRQLAYLSRRGSGYRTATVIVIRSADTNQLLRELPFQGSSLGGWAPDGQSLLIVGMTKEGRGALRVDAQTGAVSPIALDPLNHPAMRSAVWAPDGKSIYYSRTLQQGAETAFFRRDVTSGNETELIRRPLLGVPHLSPDGRFLATPSVDPTTNSRLLLLVPTGGGEAREVIRIPSEVGLADLKVIGKGQTIGAPIWAADSKSLLFRKYRSTTDEIWELWLFSLDGGAPQKLDATSANNRSLQKLHPDGKRILLATGSAAAPRQTQVWALENFLPASK